ncbi:MAG: AAA family ATPase [Actinomycetota bacterium]
MPPTSPSAFVGREAELARLGAALEDAGHGRAPAIVIEGESGAGKTRLLREFAALAADRGATVLLGRCVDCGDAGPPFWPVTEALRRLPPGDQAGDGPSGDRGGYFEEVLDRLEAAGRRSPVVLLLDDLHWADRSTRDLLGFLLANLAGGPGPLVVVTVRSEALIPGHPLLALLAELRRSRRAEFLVLDRLRKAEVAAQLTSIMGEGPEPELLEEIWRRSEGNPFFVEELLAAARSGQELTSTVQPILAARLAALSPDARTAAGAVAASVGPVSHRLLTEVAGLAEPALLAGLRECVDHHVLVADGRRGTYTFRHSLLREAAYAGLLPGEARRFHAAYGRALSAGIGGGTPVAAELAAVAWHLYAAGDAEQGLPAALAAAGAAEAAGGYAEAHLQYERALELADRSVDRVELLERAAEAAQLAGESGRAVELFEATRTAAPAEDAPRLLLGLGRARWAAGDSAGALEAYDEAIRRVHRETAEGVRAVAAAAEALMLAGRYGESRRLAEEGLALAQRLGLPLEEAEILGTLGVDLALLGDADPALRALDEAIEVAEKAAVTTGPGGGPPADGRGPRRLARALLNRAEVLSGPLNRLDEAADVAAAGVDVLRRLGLGRSYAAGLAAVLANTLFRAGRWDEADPVIETALAERPTGAPAIDLLLARARLAVGRGRLDAARADLERVDHRWTQAVAPRYRAPLLTLEAGLALWEERTADAREAVARALELVAGSDDVWLVAPVLWHGLRAEGDRAERARARGDTVDAKAAADAAATLVERAQALQRAAAPAVRPVVAAYETLCVAEALRTGAAVEVGAAVEAGAVEAGGAVKPGGAVEAAVVDSSAGTGAGEAEVWAEAAERWGALNQPYPSAYARFREAEALLKRQARSARAGAALRDAHTVAVRLGAEPFRREIEALAGRARLTLAAPSPEPSAGRPIANRRPAKAAAALPGPLDALTARERDVLRLMVEGRTNRDIAATLFISEKTASVHVSHILAKLGVRSRVQAVAVAHQAGATSRP